MADRDEGKEVCGICAYLRDLPAERIVWEDDYWICGGLLDVPGWTLVMTKRHTEGIWSLDDEEAARFGPMMRDIAGVVKEATGAERIHYAAMGEIAPHYHNAILPRLPGEVPVWDSNALVTRAEGNGDPVAALRIELELKDRLRGFANNGMASGAPS